MLMRFRVRSFFRWLAAALDRLVVVTSKIASYSILVMAILVTVDVLIRFLFGRGTKVAVEFTGYLLVVAIFLGLAYTLRENGHIRITFLIQKLSQGIQCWLAIAAYVLFLGYTTFLLYVTWHWFLTSFTFKTTSNTALDIVIWPYELFIPIGLAIISLQLISKIYTELKVALANRTDDC